MTFSNSLFATFSIIACDPKTGECGVAVATNNLAVGASVCYAQAGVGAVVSQFETNPNNGPLGLALLEDGREIQSALEEVLNKDNSFEGLGIEFRQVALIDAKGRSVTHTGAEALKSHWAGSRSGENYSIQGNGLSSEAVLLAMEKAFLESKGELPERLVMALKAGQVAGGQSSGTMSAALLVRTKSGWPHDLDLRVDADKDPVSRLHRLVNFHYARQSIIRAERLARQGEVQKAWISVADALSRGKDWDRIWLRATRFAIAQNELNRAVEYFGVFRALNPIWAKKEYSNSLYDPLRDHPLFISWSAAQ